MTGSKPSAVRSPKLAQGVAFAAFRRRAMRNWIDRYGTVFEMNVPLFGHSVVVTDAALARSVCSAGTEQLVNVQPNLSNLFGRGSVFALDGGPHRDRRRLLAPAFRGQRLRACEQIVEEATLRECANWPEGQEFRTLEPMNRVTLDVILHTLFGTDGAELDELRVIVPPWVKLGSLLAFVPVPRFPTGRFGPWGRLAALRRAYDRIVYTLIDRAETDPDLGLRTDVLAALVRTGRDDGNAIPRQHICDELLTLIGAGHETTASALAWAFERLRRHPESLEELVTEVDSGGSDLRRAAILEILRVRTVIDVAGRRVGAPDFGLGGRRIPHDRTVLVSIADLHENPAAFPDPGRFDPARFRGGRAPASAWLAFGGGPRRCLGADFALAEMDVVLRTVLRHFRIETDAAPDEKSYFRGVAHVPKRGGRIVVHRRRSS